ncbi:MAG TPA: universal stress protein [Vicinamibacterales bacterium]|nr:universal stress protein [Vicinamibacterales bacterium]
MIELTNILCPVDLSDPSRHALAYSLMLARWYGSSVTVLEVIQSPVPPTPFGSTPAAILTAADREELTRELCRFVGAAETTGISVATTVGEGQVVQEILQQARALPADLVVMGTHGRSGFERLLLGSVTERVLRKASCPVLTVPPRSPAAPEHPAPFRHILCPVDFSPASLNGLRYAISLAEESGGQLVLLHVLDWPVDRPDPAGAGVELHAHRRRLQDEALHELHVAVPEEARDWCTPTEVVGVGKPYDVILATARERRADLIVMGVHGRHAMELHVFGSTTDHVVREATCPVMTIRP